MSRHAIYVDENVHRPYRQVFANDAGRTGDSGPYVTADLYKKAYQIDTNVEYVLTATTPTWTAVGGGGGSLADTSDDQTVQTTDATVTTIATYSTLADERAISVKAVVWARQTTTDDSAKYVIEALFNRATGSVVTSKDENFISVYEDQAAWDVTFNISSQDIQIQVTGEAAKTIEWRIQLEVSEHG